MEELVSELNSVLNVRNITTVNFNNEDVEVRGALLGHAIDGDILRGTVLGTIIDDVIYDIEVDTPVVVTKEVKEEKVHPYSLMTVREASLLDVVDTTAFIKYFKMDILRCNPIFMSFKGNRRMFMVGKYLFRVKYNACFDINDGEDFIEVQKTANYLKQEGYNDVLINDFMNEVKAEREKLKGGYRCVVGDDIYEVYNHNRSYMSSCLDGSCMNGSGSRYDQFINCLENPKDLQIIAYYDNDDRLVARCLFWQEKFYDRIFANSDAIVSYVIDDLEQRGYRNIYDGQNDYTDRTKLEIKINSPLWETTTPYFDTVYYYNCDSDGAGYMTNYDGCYDYIIQSCDGEDWYDRHCCIYCGAIHDRDDMYYVENDDGYGCCDCLDEDFVYATDTCDYRSARSCVQAYDTDLYYYNESYLYCTRDTDRYYTTNDDLYYAQDSGEYYSSCDSLTRAYDTDEWFEDSDSLYYAEDSMRYFTSNDDLKYASDTDEWYEDGDNLYFTEDKGNYYTTEDDLTQTEDTQRYFESNDKLFFAVDTKAWYEYSEDLVNIHGDLYTRESTLIDA